MLKKISVITLLLGIVAAQAGPPFLNQAANTFLAAPNGSAGNMKPRLIVAADVPTLNQNTTGTASNLSGTPALPNGTTATTQAALDNSTKLATTAYADSAVAAGKGLVEANSVDIPAPTNDTYVLEQKAAYAYTINSINIQTATNTITADLKINGVVVTGCNAIAVTNANSAHNCTAANAVAIGDTVTLVTSANAASTHLSFTVKETR